MLSPNVLVPISGDAVSSVPREMVPGLRLLLQAHDYARDLDREVWDLAVEMDSLRRAGLTSSDLRWLVCKGLAEQAGEITTPRDSARRFEFSCSLMFMDAACFVLTPAGVGVARSIFRDGNPDGQNGSHPDAPRTRTNGSAGNSLADSRHVPSAGALLPEWDHDRRELRVAGLVVKQFKLPSPNQERIIVAFEEESWRPRIDDPLPPCMDIVPQQRLHSTIKSLNRNQVHRLINFMGDGTGRGIHWELTPEALEHLAQLEGARA